MTIAATPSTEATFPVDFKLLNQMGQGVLYTRLLTQSLDLEISSPLGQPLTVGEALSQNIMKRCQSCNIGLRTRFNANVEDGFCNGCIRELSCVTHVDST